MLRCVLQDVEGQTILLPQLLKLNVNIDEGVPADSLYAVFPYTPTAESAKITLYDDEKPVFDGVVDEEEHARGADGDYLKISARSIAARLLDNEAQPCSYDHPSLSLIYERYARPFGVIPDNSGDAVFFGEQSVPKGASCWRVLKQFCNACYSSVPRISSVGVLHPKGIRRDSVTAFGAGGVPYIALHEVKKRCEEISAVYVKTSNAGSYTLPIRNAEAQGRGIRRERYLNAVLTESPMRCADAMIANGKKKAYAVRLRCPSCLLGREGDSATLDDPLLGTRDDLYISAVHYRMTKDGAYSDVVLKRRTG
ncbi:hypothetical protein [Ruminococcus sp.]|uniref:hypothetical protein n=1 Tax=Ruminococcus sp. TaxID=41978 RepID=UPI003890D4A4